MQASETITCLEETATALHVSRNDPVRFLIRRGLGDIEAGTLEVPTRPILMHKRATLNDEQDGNG